MLMKYTGQNKFIFIANTKCASTSIESSEIAKIADIKLVNHNIGKHMSIGKVHERFNFIFEQYKVQDFFKFGIIRNPLDWVVSWFNFRSRIQLRNPSNPDHKNYTGEMTFAQFWDSNKNQPFLKPQYRNFFAKDRNIKLDYIILQDQLCEHISIIKEMVKTDLLTIQNKNQSTIKRITSEDVEDKIKDEIKQKYRLDYDLINNLEEFNLKGLESFKKS